MDHECHGTLTVSEGFNTETSIPARSSLVVSRDVGVKSQVLVCGTTRP